MAKNHSPLVTGQKEAKNVAAANKIPHCNKFWSVRKEGGIQRASIPLSLRQIG